MYPARERRKLARSVPVTGKRAGRRSGQARGEARGRGEEGAAGGAVTRGRGRKRREGGREGRQRGELGDQGGDERRRGGEAMWAREVGSGGGRARRGAAGRGGNVGSG